MPNLESSAISYVHYDEVAAELHVRFVGGGVYVYHAVPRGAYEALMAAPSAGTYFNAHIRDAYRYRRSATAPGWRGPRMLFRSAP